MRENHKIQPTLTEPWLDLPHAKELKAISGLLDQHPMLGALVAQDISGGSSRTGGLTGAQVLRAMVVKQMNGFSYDELAFHLADSQTYRTFCQLGIADRVPKRSTLAENIKRIKASTLEQVNRNLVAAAKVARIERGRKVRVDSTVSETNIHPPSDSALLFDCVRVLTRFMVAARELGVDSVKFSDRTRRAKRRWLGIHRARGKRQRRRLYRDLINVTKEVFAAASDMLDAVSNHKPASMTDAARLEAITGDLEWHLPLTERVLDQTRRRVFNEETVPATEKLVSIFEEHTDIIVKAPRKTQYGHKVTLTGGASSMILDCVVAKGNPADSSEAETMIDRQIEIYGQPPRQAAFDGGYTSQANLRNIKAKGVKDVAFHKKRGLEISEMTKSAWVFKKLKNFRAGIEGCISFLKRVFGLTRCTWRSFASFKSYVWASVVSFNLLVMARHLIK